MIAFRSLIALFLSLTLVWASAGQALAHLGLTPGLQVTLCDQTGQSRTVTLDANGNPVTSHDCPECLAGQAQALPFAQTAAPQPMPLALTLGDPAWPHPGHVLAIARPVQPRAPPVALD